MYRNVYRMDTASRTQPEVIFVSLEINRSVPFIAGMTFMEAY